MSTFATVIGLAAAVCTTTANLPQLKKAWTTGQTDDISLKTLLLFGCGLVLWVAYGILNDDDILFQNAIRHPQHEAAAEQQQRLEGDVVGLAGSPRLLELRQVGCRRADRSSEADYRGERAHGSPVSGSVMCR